MRDALSPRNPLVVVVVGVVEIKLARRTDADAVAVLVALN